MIKKIFIFLFVIIVTAETSEGVVSPAQNLKIKTGLTNYEYASNVEIEKIFKENLGNINDIIYTIIPMGVVISINGYLFYEEGESELKPCACQILDIMAELISSTGKNCLVESTTTPNAANTSKYKTNWELSLVRANNIEKYMLATRKVKQSKIRSNGFGEFMPFKKYQSTTQERINFIIINYEDNFRQ